MLRTSPTAAVAAGIPNAEIQAINDAVQDTSYTPRGGTVAIFAEHRPEFMVLGVRDTGSGIAPEDMPRIWERLYRGDRSRSMRGLDLGIALVKAIAKAHGGEAEVTSQPDAGAVFRLILPARQMA